MMDTIHIYYALSNGNLRGMQWKPPRTSVAPTRVQYGTVTSAIDILRNNCYSSSYLPIVSYLIG